MTKKQCPNTLSPGERELSSFYIIKNMLMNPPILRVPDFSRPFIIQADASNVGVASCLVQDFDGEEHPISCLG